MTLTDLFLRAAARHGDQVAVDIPPGPYRAERQRVRYRELAGMAASLQRALQPFVDGERTVVVLLPRSTPWLYAAQLGVLLAGGAHVCLDGSFPDAHLRRVVEAAGAVAVITDARGAQRFEGVDVPCVNVEALSIEAAMRAVPADGSFLHDDDRLAYVIFTSGTTGAPKGVMLEHRGAVNLIERGVARFGMGPGDRVAQGSSPAYDSSVEETWLALASGATVVSMDDDVVRLGPDLVDWLHRERITVLCPPPTLLRAMDCVSPADELPALRLCYVGGEPLSADLASRWGEALWLENGYGPTECTVTVVRGRVRAGEDVTIGTPVPPHVAHVLDGDLQPVSVGQPGELCIAGPGLARGYLGLAELTAARFPELPEIGRVYRTGDLVVEQPDGRLRCLGRIDAQVKVRGYRIELEAIEAVLARCDGVREVVCAAQVEEPERVLVAHIVCSDRAAPPDFDELAAAIRAELPGYMVPARFACIDAVPRSVGGKVDRSRLPAIERATTSAVIEDGASLAEIVRAHFGNVLGIAVGELAGDHDFFGSPKAAVAAEANEHRRNRGRRWQ